MKQISLEIELSKLGKISSPKSRLEQYFTPSDTAAEILYKALQDGDIADKVVADFGTGNGIFAIGASLLGAKRVYAIDSDKEMIDIAARNAKKCNVKIEFIRTPVEEFNEKVDTVVMNPPFGSQRRNADVPFIKKAMELSKDFYIILNYKSGDFLRKFVAGKGEVLWEYKIDVPLSHNYSFQRKETKVIEAKVAKVKVWNRNT